METDRSHAANGKKMKQVVAQLLNAHQVEYLLIGGLGFGTHPWEVRET
jgi:hypothetical protein